MSINEMEFAVTECVTVMHANVWRQDGEDSSLQYRGEREGQGGRDSVSLLAELLNGAHLGRAVGLRLVLGDGFGYSPRFGSSPWLEMSRRRVSRRDVPYDTLPSSLRALLEKRWFEGGPIGGKANGHEFIMTVDHLSVRGETRFGGLVLEPRALESGLSLPGLIETRYHGKVEELGGLDLVLERTAAISPHDTALQPGVEASEALVEFHRCLIERAT